MVPQKQIDEFVTRLQQAAGDNLQSAILYGSAAGGDFHPEFSNVNLLCILRETSFAALTALSEPVEWWTRHKHPAPLVMTREELERSADVFAIEFLDMQRRHRVLVGDDALAGLKIPMRRHRAQVEYELREKLILLRQHLLSAAGDQKALWELMLRSLPSFATLIRHALLALDGAAPDSSREAVQAAAARIPFDASAFEQLFDVRERKADRKQFELTDLFSRYLNAVQQVAAAVDTMLDSEGTR